MSVSVRTRLTPPTSTFSFRIAVASYSAGMHASYTSMPPAPNAIPFRRSSPAHTVHVLLFRISRGCRPITQRRTASTLVWEARLYKRSGRISGGCPRGISQIFVDASRRRLQSHISHWPAGRNRRSPPFIPILRVSLIFSFRLHCTAAAAVPASAVRLAVAAMRRCGARARIKAGRS